MRVVIDTNVFVSGLMLPASVPGRILAAAHSGAFEIVLSEPILQEIAPFQELLWCQVLV